MQGQRPELDLEQHLERVHALGVQTLAGDLAQPVDQIRLERVLPRERHHHQFGLELGFLLLHDDRRHRFEEPGGRDRARAQIARVLLAPGAQHVLDDLLVARRQRELLRGGRLGSAGDGRQRRRRLLALEPGRARALAEVARLAQEAPRAGRAPAQNLRQLLGLEARELGQAVATDLAQPPPGRQTAESAAAAC